MEFEDKRFSLFFNAILILFASFCFVIGYLGEYMVVMFIVSFTIILFIVNDRNHLIRFDDNSIEMSISRWNLKDRKKFRWNEIKSISIIISFISLPTLIIETKEGKTYLTYIVNDKGFATKLSELKNKSRALNHINVAVPFYFKTHFKKSN